METKYNSLRPRRDLPNLENVQHLLTPNTASLQFNDTLEAAIGDIILSFINIMKPMVAEAVRDAVSSMTPLVIPTEPNDDLFDRKQAAEYMRCTKGTIDNWRRSGKLSFSKIEGKVLIKKSELLAAINASSDFR